MLSIIIPTLNEEKFLPLLLDSIKSQNFFDFEVIVSDANSEDKTREVAIRAGAKVVIDSRRHPSFQRNAGAKEAKGDIFLFLDADTILPDNFLKDVVEEFKQRQLGIAGFYLSFGRGKLIYYLCSFGYNFFVFFRQYWHPVSVGAGIICRAAVHRQINGFDESLFLAEDYDYCDRAAKISKFRILKKRKLTYSTRRMEKEGHLKVLFKWLKMGLITVRGKKIKKPIVDYKFGRY